MNFFLYYYNDQFLKIPVIFISKGIFQEVFMRVD